MDFQQADKEFKQLKRRYAAGEITEAEFKARLEDLMVQDERGNWWMLGFESERWYRYDGKAWAEDIPPGFTASAPQQNLPPAESGADPRTREALQEHGASEVSKPATPAAKQPPRGWLLPGALVGLGLLAAIYILPKWIRGAPATPSAIPGYYETQQAAFATEPPATEAPAAAATIAPTEEIATFAPAATTAPQILFQDDFAGSGPGWTNAYRSSDMFFQYSLLAETLGQFVWAYPNEAFDFSDVSLEVDAVKKTGPADGYFGLICRFQDTYNFTYLGVEEFGRYVIGENRGGNLFNLADGDVNSYVKGTMNHLGADCIGSTLTLYVNGEQVASVEGSLGHGNFGLFVWDTVLPENSAAFDNFVVTQP